LKKLKLGKEMWAAQMIKSENEFSITIFKNNYKKESIDDAGFEGISRNITVLW
jgi:hypothetical protein